MKLGTVSGLIAIPEGEDPVLARIPKAAALGVSVLGVSFREGGQMEPDYLKRVNEASRRQGITLRLMSGGNFYLHGAEAEAEVGRVVEALHIVARYTDIRMTSIISGPMLTTHRWTPGLPIAERLATVATNLGAVAEQVADAGFTLALENHCDYRGHEIAAIIEGANRPNLRVQLDTGNPFSVFEEPVDCARVLAPLTVSVHLKDIAVTPFAPAPCQGTRGVSAPLGEGHVDNVAVCDLLHRHAPDAANLALICEPFYMPQGADRAAFLDTSLRWAREHLAPYLD